jgi:hypothetical protein
MQQEAKFFEVPLSKLSSPFIEVSFFGQLLGL